MLSDRQGSPGRQLSPSPHSQWCWDAAVSSGWALYTMSGFGCFWFWLPVLRFGSLRVSETNTSYCNRAYYNKRVELRVKHSSVSLTLLDLVIHRF